MSYPVLTKPRARPIVRSRPPRVPLPRSVTVVNGDGQRRPPLVGTSAAAVPPSGGGNGVQVARIVWLLLVTSAVVLGFYLLAAVVLAVWGIIELLATSVR